jgi:hypothetical protein
VLFFFARTCKEYVLEKIPTVRIEDKRMKKINKAVSDLLTYNTSVRHAVRLSP